VSASVRRLLACVIAAAVLCSGVIATANASTAAPSRPTVVSTSDHAIALSWKAVSGAPKYRVQFSTSSSMNNARYARFVNPYAEITGLKAGTTYYFRVRSITASGGNLSRYSSTLKARTRAADGYGLLAPTGLTSTQSSPDSLAVTWNARSADVRYRVSWSTTSTFAAPHYARVTGTSYSLRGLTAGTKYYLKVRVIDTDGVNLSSYSPAISAAISAASGPLSLPPTKLRVTAAAHTATALAWAEVPGAERYRIQYSTAASMSSAHYVSVSGGSAEIGGLAAGKAYYFRIRVIASDGTNLSPYSAAVSTRTPTSAAATYLPPAGMKLTVQGSNKIAASWSSRGTGLSYEVVYADNEGLAGALTEVTTSTSATVTGLRALTAYWMRVRVVEANGTSRTALSAPAPLASATTPESVPSTLRVASYNVKCANCYSALPNEGTWYARRQAVVKTILAQKPDVIGIQEASQAWLKADDGTGRPISLSQYEDLNNRLDSPYKLTNAHRNNCVRSSTPSKCVYKDQGASQGTRIIFNSTALTLVDQGSKRLAEVSSSDNDRYVTWAILEQKSTGKRFFFANTHLEHLSDEAGSTAYSDLRINQTRQIVALVESKAKGLPTYVVGDFNSNKWTSPSNGPYDVMTAARFVDPLGNSYHSTTRTSGATVEHRVRTNFSSYNGYQRKARSTSYVNGSYIDYIWTSSGIEVPEWETVVDIDSAGNFIGTIPSDHNLIRATTILP
jgi:endonuclease/exonuclease/phosphatase family metal-dependent hydrolase